MKKVLLGVLVLGSMAVAAPAKTSLEQSLSNLEQQLQKLDQMEEQKFNEQAALASAAQERLNKYQDMSTTIDQRLADIEANADKSIFGREFKSKASEFRSLKSELQKEIAKEQKIINDFELLKSLR